MPTVDFDKLFFQADNFRNNGRVDEAVKAYVDIANLSRDTHQPQHIARALHLAGVASKESIQGKNSYYEQANRYFSAALEAFSSQGDFVGAGAVYRDMAVASDQAGDSGEALVYFQQSVNFLKKAEDEAPAQLGITLSKIGQHYLLQNDLETALKFSERGMKYLRQEPSAGFFMATALYGMAKIQLLGGHTSEAVQSAEESLSWFEAEHEGEQHRRRLVQLNGFLSIGYDRLGDKKKSDLHKNAYYKNLESMDPLAIKVVQREMLGLSA